MTMTYMRDATLQACPLNPRTKDEAGEPGSESAEQWQEFSQFFTPAIRNVVNFAKNLPGFQLFSQEDQITLLKVRRKPRPRSASLQASRPASRSVLRPTLT